MKLGKTYYPAGVYRIVNTRSGKAYVGSSVQLRSRFSAHRGELNRGTHHCQPLQRAWSKYSADAFRFEVLVYCDRNDVLFFEQRFIDAGYGAYNTCRTAGNCAGVRQTEARKAAVSERHKGKATSAETRTKMSEAARGRVFSIEHRAKMSEARREYVAKNGTRPLSNETRARIGAANKGRQLTDEHKAKIGAATRARAPKAPDLVRKIRALADEGVNMSKIARTLGVPRTSVRRIVSGQAYQQVN